MHYSKESRIWIWCQTKDKITWSDGFSSVHGMNKDYFFHSRETLQRQGLVQIPNNEYPSIYGGSLDNNTALYAEVGDSIRLEGRNITSMTSLIWTEMNKVVEMEDHHPKWSGTEHYLKRAVSVQRFFVDAQNLCANAIDEARKDLDLITRLPRSYKEWDRMDRD